jgi:hypothetical protein
MAATPEGTVKAGVKKTLAKFCEGHDVFIYTEWPVPGGYGKSGLDMIGVVFGHCFMIETKAPNKVITDRQLMTTVRAEKAGARVFIIDEVKGPQHDELTAWLLSLVETKPS